MIPTLHRILLAEDDQDDIELFLEAIDSVTNEVDVTVVNDGQACLDLARKSTFLFDIFFLDINMPRLNGLKCLQALREISEYHRVPVVMLSTASDMKTIQLAYSCGANLYLKKEWEYSVFTKEIRSALDRFVFNPG